MVVRVKVRIERSGKVVETSALANSGYEAETPQLLTPIRLAETLGLWPPQIMSRSFQKSYVKHSVHHVKNHYPSKYGSS